MKTTNFTINLPLNYKQIVDLVKQLPTQEKIKLKELLKRETSQLSGDGRIQTHLAPEGVLAKDWLSPEEDLAWKDL